MTMVKEHMSLNHDLEIKSIVSSIHSIIIGIVGKDRIAIWNPAAEKIFGIKKEDVFDKVFITCGIKWDWNLILEGLLQCLESMQPYVMKNVSFESLDLNKGFLDLHINPIIKSSGTVIGYILWGDDITERKSLETQLAQTQKLEAIGQLAAGIAHEINTPVQYIGDNINFLSDAFCDLKNLFQKIESLEQAFRQSSENEHFTKKLKELKQQADLEYLFKEIPAAIEQSLQGIQHVAKIVRAMKEFSHPGTKEKVEVDLNKNIKNTCEVSKNEWKYVADLKLDLDEKLPLVLCMAGSINQVFLNIIINAAHSITDFLKPHSKNRGLITISSKQEGAFVIIQISDTGTGIAENIRSKIFDPFFTTKEVGQGTGQGLALARSQIVDLHGGSIVLESEVGLGSTFIISLPIEGEPRLSQ